MVHHRIHNSHEGDIIIRQHSCRHDYFGLFTVTVRATCNVLRYKTSDFLAVVLMSYCAKCTLTSGSAWPQVTSSDAECIEGTKTSSHAHPTLTTYAMFPTVLNHGNDVHEPVGFRQMKETTNICSATGLCPWITGFYCSYMRSEVSNTYSMEQSPSWEANRFTASQEILRI